jgi:3-oxoacyl-[acyl-carrier protein] reductase
VTGAARGIGRAIVERLVADGVAVGFSYLRHADEAAEVERQLREAGGAAMAIRADVASADDCARLVRETVERFGRLDILVNNAAETDTHRPWTDISEADWDRVMEVNAKGAFLCFRAAHPYLLASPAGRVINISSVTFSLGQARMLHYVSSKGALVGFTRSLAREIGREGITVNAVAPGAIRTEMEVELFPGQEEAAARQMAELQAIPRRGAAVDIAGAVAFFASDDAAFVTGQTLIVDGGWAMA